MSGQVGSPSDGSPQPDFEAQVRLAFANLKTTLQAGRCKLDDMVDVTTFHTDPKNQFGTIMRIKSEVFPEAPYPNWTAIGVAWLAGFDFESKSSLAFRGEMLDGSSLRQRLHKHLIHKAPTPTLAGFE